MNRQWMIDWLINSDLKYSDRNKEYMALVLREGSRGYNSLPDAELIAMVEQRQEDIKMEQVDAITEDAIAILCKFVQDKLGVGYGDIAGQFWASEDHINIIRSYIKSEIDYQGD
jgi:hypothetical protein